MCHHEAKQQVTWVPFPVGQAIGDTGLEGSASGVLGGQVCPSVLLADAVLALAGVCRPGGQWAPLVLEWPAPRSSLL